MRQNDKTLIPYDPAADTDADDDEIAEPGADAGDLNSRPS